MVFFVFLFTGKFVCGSEIRVEVRETARGWIHRVMVHASRDTLKQKGDGEENGGEKGSDSAKSWGKKGT